MKQALVRWWHKRIQRLRTSSLVTAWMGVNSNRDSLYEPLVYAARAEEQEGRRTAEQDPSEQAPQGQNHVGRE